LTPERLQQLKRWLSKLWLLSPERLWLLSIALRRRGHWLLAFWIKQLNTLLYRNSLGTGASVGPGIYLGHNSMGIVVTSNVEIGRRVVIWHNVTLAAGRPPRTAQRGGATGHGDDQPSGPAVQPSPGAGSKIIVEDDVVIGANAVLIGPRGGSLRIGRGARIGAGTVVTVDVPPGATVVSQPVRVLPRAAAGLRSSEEQPEGDRSSEEQLEPDPSQ
jgi:serine O-acetyltransferase